MANKMLKPLAKMGRASGVTRDELVAKLAKFGNPEEVASAVDEVMAIPEEQLTGEISSLVRAQAEVQPHIDSGEGVNIDSRGFDEADRRTESFILGALGDDGEDLN